MISKESDSNNQNLCKPVLIIMILCYSGINLYSSLPDSAQTSINNDDCRVSKCFEVAISNWKSRQLWQAKLVWCELTAMTRVTGDIESRSRRNSGSCQLILKTLWLCYSGIKLYSSLPLPSGHVLDDSAIHWYACTFCHTQAQDIQSRWEKVEGTLLSSLYSFACQDEDHHRHHPCFWTFFSPFL